MFRSMKKSKIHRATITESDLNYVGSITIDRELMRQADIYDNEKVLVVDVENGQRFETYAIPGEAGSGVICVNGAAARLVHKGDKVIIITFALYSEQELEAFETKSILVNENNQCIRIEH